MPPQIRKHPACCVVEGCVSKQPALVSLHVVKLHSRLGPVRLKIWPGINTDEDQITLC
jgi:hypothetical protein